jgi:ADP-ribose pyrophosphatase YjhB (NUDIX family)
MSLKLPHDEYLKSIPRKRVSAGALFFNAAGELLIVKPNYLDQWNIPGGAGELNESPQRTCNREVHEEIGLSQKFDRLLVIDHLFNQETLDESLLFIFHGGELSTDQINKIQLQADELDGYTFKPIAECTKLLSPNMAKRLPLCMKALEKKETMLLESGKDNGS